MCDRGSSCGPLLRAPHQGGLRLGRRVSAIADSLDVVARHWRIGDRVGRFGVSQALGVGYETIGALLQGDLTTKALAGILVVKLVIWAVALGSGTSGGVLAPLLMLGGALGG